MTDADRPLDWTYQEYRETIKTHAETMIEEWAKSPDDTDDVHQALDQTLRDCHTLTFTGWAHMAVILSDQHPDHPDYSDGWTVYADLSDPEYSGIIRAMARVCMKSDILEYLFTCQDCSGRGHTYDEEANEIECETCGGDGERLISNRVIEKREELELGEAA